MADGGRLRVDRGLAELNTANEEDGPPLRAAGVEQDRAGLLASERVAAADGVGIAGAGISAVGLRIGAIALQQPGAARDVVGDAGCARESDAAPADAARRRVDCRRDAVDVAGLGHEGEHGGAVRRGHQGPGRGIELPAVPRRLPGGIAHAAAGSRRRAGKWA